MTRDSKVINITPAAATQIRVSAEHGGTGDWLLRIAVRRADDGAFHYAMGFDNVNRDSDLGFKSEGVSVVVESTMVGLLKGMTIDYVELEAGGFHFIFLNPNDPAYVPPATE